MKSHLLNKKFRSTAVLLCSLGFSSCGQLGPEFLGQPPETPPIVRLADVSPEAKVKVVPQSYIVMFKTENYKSNLFFSSFADEYSHHYSFLNSEFETDARIKNIDVLSTVEMTADRKSEWEPEFNVPNALQAFSSQFGDDSADAGVMARVDFASEFAGVEVLSEWEQNGKIWYAEPNEISHFSAGELAEFGKQYDNLQEWHKVINLAGAYKALAENKVTGQGTEEEILTSGPVIAVLDSGVDYDHPQLVDGIWENTAVGSAGCVGDVHGCNTTAVSKGTLGNGDVWPVIATGPGVSCGNGDTEAKCDHGTHVAGIVAAKPNGTDQVGGVCPFCKVMILRVGEVEEGDSSGNPLIKDDSQIRAFKYLTRFRKSGGSAVRIVNASFGKYSRSRSLAILVDVLKKVGSGTLVIGAASNEDSMVRSYPAALANAIAVASTGVRGAQDSMQKSDFSNYGPWVDIAAPGSDITSTLSGSSNGKKSGTSMAAPVVAGCAGLLLSAFPNLGFNELRERILNSANATKLYGSETPGSQMNGTFYYTKISGEAARRPLLGGGIVDVEAMVKGSKSSATGQPLARVTPGCGVISGEVSHGFKISFLLLGCVPLLLVFIRRRGPHG